MKGFRIGLILSLAAMAALGSTPRLFAQARKAGSAGNGEFPSFITFAGAPEGVAVDKVGNVYVSMAGLDQDELWAFSPSGEGRFVAALGAPPGGESGLAVDAEGNVYAARKSPPMGVFRIDRKGSVSLLPGTDQMFFPNALAFDPRGNLYITESLSLTDSGYGQGGIWWVPRGGSATLLLRDELLTGAPPHLLGFPVGANGIGWFNGNLFVANTERAVVLQIPVRSDGLLGQPDVWAEVNQVSGSIFEGVFPVLLDGLALDVHGNVYVAVPSQCAIVRIYAADRAQDSVAVYPEDPLDAPLSLAFGTGKGNKQALFITNGGMLSLFLPGQPWPGFGLVRAEAGMPGLPMP